MLEFVERIVETVTLFVLHTIDAWGYIGVFTLMALESANIPIPSEIIMPFSGFLAGTGAFVFWTVVLVGALGNLVGSWISYWAAIKLNSRIKKNKDFLRAERWFERFGELSVFLARLLPVMRTFISFPAGMFRVNLFRFSIYTFVGSFIWSAFLAYLGFYLGENWDVLSPYFRRFDYLIVGAFGIVFLWWLRHHFAKQSREAADK